MMTRATVSSRRRETVSIGVCSLAVILALVAGVGLASGLVIRHVVQTAPMWLGVLIGFRGSPAVKWLALPMFLFWLLLMALIWLFLLGLPSPLSGHFSPTEIAMTIVVGAASLVGIWAAVRVSPGMSIAAGAALFLGAATLQVICFRVSLLPAIAHR
jgi:hypothetical protein